MQDGSGTNHLTSLFNCMMNDDTYFEKRNKIKKDYNVSIRSKESMYYFEIFKDLHDFDQSQDHEGSCPYCHYKTENSKFCRMCGAFPI